MREHVRRGSQDASEVTSRAGVQQHPAQLLRQGLNPESIVALQRSAGNRATGQLLRSAPETPPISRAPEQRLSRVPGFIKRIADFGMGIPHKVLHEANEAAIDLQRKARKHNVPVGKLLDAIEQVTWAGEVRLKQGRAALVGPDPELRLN